MGKEGNHRCLHPSTLDHYNRSWQRGQAAQAGQHGGLQGHRPVRGVEAVHPEQRDLVQGAACQGGSCRGSHSAPFLHENETIPAPCSQCSQCCHGSWSNLIQSVTSSSNQPTNLPIVLQCFLNIHVSSISPKCLIIIF